jgi:hypothetical protein
MDTILKILLRYYDMNQIQEVLRELIIKNLPKVEMSRVCEPILFSFKFQQNKNGIIVIPNNRFRGLEMFEVEKEKPNVVKTIKSEIPITIIIKVDN